MILEQVTRRQTELTNTGTVTQMESKHGKTNCHPEPVPLLSALSLLSGSQYWDRAGQALEWYCTVASASRKVYQLYWGPCKRKQVSWVIEAAAWLEFQINQIKLLL